MDLLAPLLLVAIVVLALAWSLFGRARRRPGGITPQPPPPGRASGSAQDTGEPR